MLDRTVDSRYLACSEARALARPVIARPPRSTRAQLRSVCTVSAPTAAAAPPREASRAVVIGGSVAGIFTAAVAAPFFDEVIVLERDPEIPAHEGAAKSADGAEYMACARARIGSPQFMQLHVFLKRGWELANSFLPGLEERAVAAGAVQANSLAETKEIVNGVTLQHKNATKALTWVQATRFVLERVLRERLLATHGNVQLRCGAWVSGIDHGNGDAHGSVTGVRLKNGETLPADLIVDASGRVSRVQAWLRDGGYALPRSVEVNAGVGYSGAIFDIPQEATISIGSIERKDSEQCVLMMDKLGWKCFYLRPKAPDTRGAVAMVIEGGRMQIIAIGYGFDYPPAGLPGMTRFMDSLKIPEISELMRAAKPLFDPVAYRGATNRRRYYEEVALPRNLVILGDAVCTFNPAYGQGITTAALQAATLQNNLQITAAGAAGRLSAAQLATVAAATQKDIADALAFPFQIATSEDLKYETTKGPRNNSPFAGFLADYFQDLYLACVEDEGLALTFREVGHMVAPVESLFGFPVASKVLMFRLRRFFKKLLPNSGPVSAPAPSPP